MRKLLFVCNVDWFFISHRLPIALKALNDGWEVHLAAGITDKRESLEKQGIKVHCLPLKRSGTSIYEEIKVFIVLNQIVKSIIPDIVHTITVKGVIYGGIVSRINKVSKTVASISGMGYVFIEKSYKAVILKIIIKHLYKLAIGSNTQVIFQNRDDESIFLKNKIIEKKQSFLIRGSGVDLTVFKFIKEPINLKIVMFVSRLLKDKGVIEFYEAAKKLQNLENVKFVLVGDIDLDNPNSLNESELNALVESGLVEHWGFSNDIDKIIPQSNIIVLPSYREGLPKSLIEAAACGRAVITTNVPGCRDAVEPNVTALLVDKKNSHQLSNAILKLIENDEMRLEFGKAGRELAEENFNIDYVVAAHFAIYRGEY